MRHVQKDSSLSQRKQNQVRDHSKNNEAILNFMQEGKTPKISKQILITNIENMGLRFWISKQM